MEIRRFHLPMRIIKTYHQVILLSIVGYGACVWAHRLNNVVPARAVRSIQRNVLLRLTGAYRTVATDALNVALGVWPLDLLVRKRATGYWKRKNNWEKVRILTSPEVETSEDVVVALLREWQRRWESSETGRRAYQLFPNVVERIDNAHLEPSPGLVQFITGKGPYPESLRKMGLVETDRCECGEVGTPEHVDLECARTLEIRPNQQEVQGRLVGDILRDPAHGRQHGKRMDGLENVSLDTCVLLVPGNFLTPCPPEIKVTVNKDVQITQLCIVTEPVVYHMSCHVSTTRFALLLGVEHSLRSCRQELRPKQVKVQSLAFSATFACHCLNRAAVFPLFDSNLTLV
uniref:Reverse transcriptase n=1 Tax=Timema shepardi TaxID=629360 RepID=A0A7R9AZI1_TIMSH|nr:unnamed protein product [Timema shepardi]